MGELGTNIDRNFMIDGEVMEDPQGLYESGVKEIRVPFSPWMPYQDARDYFQTLRTGYGMRVMLVFDKPAMKDFPWESADYDERDAFGVRHLSAVANELYDYVDLWQFGNEPDLKGIGEASWGMDQEPFIHFQKVGSYVVGREKTVAGGLALGDPNWIRGWGMEQYVAKGAFHPYGQGTPDVDKLTATTGSVVLEPIQFVTHAPIPSHAVEASIQFVHDLNKVKRAWRSMRRISSLQTVADLRQYQVVEMVKTIKPPIPMYPLFPPEFTPQEIIEKCIPKPDF